MQKRKIFDKFLLEKTKSLLVIFSVLFHFIFLTNFSFPFLLAVIIMFKLEKHLYTSRLLAVVHCQP